MYVPTKFGTNRSVNKGVDCVCGLELKKIILTPRGPVYKFWDFSWITVKHFIYETANITDAAPSAEEARIRATCLLRLPY